jgi:hypothetical protein
MSSKRIKLMKYVCNARYLSFCTCHSTVPSIRSKSTNLEIKTAFFLVCLHVVTTMFIYSEIAIFQTVYS